MGASVGKHNSTKNENSVDKATSAETKYDLSLEDNCEVKNASVISTDDSDDEYSDDDKLGDMIGSIPYQPNPKGRHSVSAEAYGKWNKKRSFKPPKYEKSEEDKKRILNFGVGSFVLQGLSDDDMHLVLDAFCKVKYAKGDIIIKQGDDGNCLYMIDSGIVKIYQSVQGDASIQKFLCESKEGEIFGELALMYNAPRAATVIADTGTVTLWSLERECFTHIVSSAVAKKRAMYEDILRKVKIFKGLNMYEVAKIADALKENNHKKDSKIISEGDHGDTFYVLVKGTAIAKKNGIDVMKYSIGDYFGELALLLNQPRAATVIAVTDCITVSLNRPSFQRLLGPVEGVMRRNEQHYDKIMKSLNIDTT